MGLYLGSNKKKLYLDNNVYCINLYVTSAPTINGDKLLSSDNYILKDLNGLFLTVKEDE